MRTALERSPLGPLRIVGLLDLLGPLKRRWLSPETSSGPEMIELARALVRSGIRVLDLTFHSPSLLPGATPFVKSDLEKNRFLDRIEMFLEYAAEQRFQFATVSEARTRFLSGEVPPT